MSQLSSTSSTPTKVYIAYGKEAPFNQLNSAESQLGEPDNVEISTNLDLVSSADNTAHIEHMEINVDYRQDPFPGLLAITKHLGNTPVLDKVTKLSIALCAQNWGYKMNDATLDEREHDVDMFSACLLQTFPNVSCISFIQCHNNYAARTICGKITAGYADQLTYLHGVHAFKLPAGIFFKHLQTADFNYDGSADFQLPQMNPSCLVKLFINNAPPNFSWLKTFSNGESKIIEFSNLKYLDLIYKSLEKKDVNNSTVYSDQGMRLHFPKLERLKIGRMSGQSALLSAAIYPKHMRAVEVGASWFEFEYIAEMNLPAADRVRVELENSNGCDMNVFPYINKMLCNTGSSNNTQLEIMNCHPPLVANDITCLDLNSIILNVPINVDVLVGLIEKLPELNSLLMLSQIPEAVETDISIANIEEHQQQRLVPFNTKLSSINLCFRSFEYPVELMVAVVGYLLLRTPTLKKLNASQVKRGPVVEFVHKFAQLYPHITNVDFRLK